MVGGYDNDYLGLPVIYSLDSNNFNNSQGRLLHDSYRVYVNDDFLGNKQLITQGEKIEDVDSYLKNQGFHDFKANLSGNEYKISVEGIQTKDVKDTLAMYLNNR